jgi:hypothetical protein
MLGRPLKVPQVRSVMKGSKSKFANLLRITHRDEVEPPITDWLLEAYRLPDCLAAGGKTSSGKKNTTKKKTAAAAGRKRKAVVIRKSRRRSSP